MPKNMMTGAHMRVAQIGDRMYSTVMGASHPERALKDEVMRIKEAVSPEQLDAVLGRVYTKLGRNVRTAPMAGYMKDLYGLPTAHRLFDPQKHTVQIDVAKVLRNNVGELMIGRIPSVGRVKYALKNGNKGRWSAYSALRSVKVTKAAKVETLLFPKKTTVVSESSETSASAVGAGGNPNDKLNLKAVTDFCLRAKYYDDVYPIYVMLLDLFWRVDNEEWVQAKETIQAHLEQLSPRGANNTIHNGDVVNQKHVNHIDTVKDNAVGFVEKTTATRKNDGRKKPAPSSKIVTDVYKYAYYDSKGGTQRITQLYQALKKLGWIDQETDPDSFLQLFSGEPGSFYIKWTGATSDLYALMKRLHDDQLITCSSKAGIWEIAQNHFKDKENKSYTNLNKQKEKKRSQKTIDILMGLLLPKT